jgi:aerotolerance regulator-like protein
VLGFLAPLWLAGLGALAVPVALHLWSRRGGRPIRVGSIRLLAGSPPATRRSWIIQDPWLLALRCTVLAALALALARPFWAARAPKAHSMALVASEVVDRASLVDSLRQAGLAVSVLEDDAGRTPNLWAALRRADRTASPGTRFVVFAPDRLRYFAGERPTLRARVEWHTRAAVRSGEASPRATAARTVVVFADPARLDDARYVSAAFTAAGDATGIVAVVSNHVASAGAVPGSADWIVWLSERAIPEQVLVQLRRGAVLLADAGAATAQRHRSRILTGGGPQPSDVWTARVVRATPGGAPVWMDGTGAPLLTVTSEGRGRLYRFYSRFFPAWSDLVLRPAFPMAMARLWSGADSIRVTPDDRRITVSQLLPAEGPSAPMTPGVPRHSLFIPLWIAAVLAFLLERRLSARSA